LYHLKTADQRVGEVLSALAEGLSMGAAVRVFRHSEATIATWLSRSATHAEKLRTGFFCCLQSLHIQLDELRTTLRDQGQAVWLWLAFDTRTKIIAAAQFGPRTQAVAHALIH
jgi:hypothetical protein